MPATVALAALAVIGYMVSKIRRGKADFTLMDALILAVIIAVLGGTGIPVIEALCHRANSATLKQNLQTVRQQIELYKVEHGGQVPVLYEGTFPQLLRPTNAQGIPGKTGKAYPFGPYLQGGMPVNPMTGCSLVTTIDQFPPKAASGTGGWLYCQATGEIAPDLPDHLND